MESLIKEIQSNHIKTLQFSLEKGKVNTHTQVFDCESLTNYLDNDIRRSIEFESFFSKLKAMNGPVLYNFKMLSSHEHSDIRKKFNDYKTASGARASSATHKYTINGSTYLYVGKVKTNISGRIITHLGFNTSPKTSGLQLFHWAKGLNLKLELNLIEFVPAMADLMGVIELKAAQNLHPIIGKHK